MYRLRPFQTSDLEKVEELAYQAQTGMANLPKNPKRLKAMGELSLHSFQSKISNPFYIFILENSETKEVLGISGIRKEAAPLEYYRVKSLPLPRLYEEVSHSTPLLERVKYTEASSEICALFLTPSAREHHLGKLLSWSRFYFIAAFPDRFTEQIFANMRGIIHPDGECPFWNGVGRHFLPISYHELMDRRDKTEEPFASLLPSLPIYIDLLPLETKNAIGQTHMNTRPALKMLLELGFSPTGEVDLYDAGPIVMAETPSIKIIKDSQTLVIDAIADEVHAPLQLLSNERLDFKAVFGTLDTSSRTLDRQSAHDLEIDVGSTIRYSL